LQPLPSGLLGGLWLRVMPLKNPAAQSFIH
jgi:hypothetical protein